MTFQIVDSVNAPARPVREQRMTAELKGMKPGQSAYPLDLKTKLAFVAYARYKGWEISVQKDDGVETWRVWRLADKVSGQASPDVASANC